MKAKNVKYPIYDYGQLSVSISKGNGKLGNIPQFNLLPSGGLLQTAKGQVLTNIVGTCGKYCKECESECYAIRCALFHHNSVVPAWARNTLLMRECPEKVRSGINEYCQKNVVRYFRFHTSGELESVAHLQLYAAICNDNPDVTFFIYTKAFDLLQEWFEDLEKHNAFPPDNLVINLSEWHGNLEFLKGNCHPYFKRCHIFSYDDNAPECQYSHLPHCPAIDKQGHETGVTCAQCRRCMKGYDTAVYAH